MRSQTSVATAILVTSLIAGCAPREFADPIAAMGDRSLSTRENLAAMEQAALVAPDDPDRIEMLKFIATGPGFTMDLRREAIDRLLAWDEPQAREALRLRLPYLPNWDVLMHVAGLAADRGWTEFTPALIRSLARPSALFADDRERPEWKALQKLHPDREVADLVFQMVAEPPVNAVHARWRLDAWELMHRLEDPGRIYALLRSAPVDDPLLEDLQAAAMELMVIPRTKEEILWLRTIRQPTYADWWERLRQASRRVPLDHLPNLRLRHLAPLAIAADRRSKWLDMDRTQLLDELSDRLSDRPEQVGVRLIDAPTFRRTGRETAGLAALTWPDLITVLLADEMLRDPNLRAELFRQADADFEDTTTEYGGLLDWRGAAPEAIAFEPVRREHDHKFYAPDAMFIRGYVAPFHYHFHAQSHDNAEFATPGLGDLEYVNSKAVNALVLTFVDEGTLNVDYYQEGKTVVDLGRISR